MAIQFQEAAVIDGREGIATMTFALLTDEYNDPLLGNIFKEQVNGEGPVSFAEAMRNSDKPYIAFESDNFPRRVEVPFERFIEEYKDLDFEKAFLLISTKFMVKNP